MKKLFLMIFVFMLLVILVSCGEIYSIKYLSTEGGTISGNNEQNVKKEEKTAEVEAVADEGYEFVSWSDGNTSSKRTDVATSDMEISAIFKKKTFVLSYKSEGGGTITGETSQSVNYGDYSSECEAVPNKGYKFVSWDDGVLTEKRKDIAKENIEYKAVFEKIAYSAEYKSGNGGHIAGEPQQSVLYGEETKEVEAVADNEEYYFVSWSDGVTSPKRKDTITEDTTIEAIFDSYYATVTYKFTEGGSIEGELVQKVLKGTKASTVKAVADEEYGFYAWSDESTKKSRTDEITEDVEYTAIFKKKYVVTFRANSTYGSISGIGRQAILEGGSTSMVTARAKAGYEFDKWSNGSTDTSIAIVPDSSVEIEALFRIQKSQFPYIVINTENGEPIVSREEYLNCTVSITDDNELYSVENVSAKIRGRGNSTWEVEKKPYKLKFDKKIDLFGNGEAKDWVLIANYFDLSLVRQYLAFQVGAVFDKLWTTSSTQFVDLYLNDEYLGVYMLCEQVEVQKNRVDIDKNVQNVDTGYLIEIDARATADDNKFVIGGKNHVIKFPKVDDEYYTDAHYEFIKQYLNDAYDAILNSDYATICQYIDVESFAQAYIVFELFNCVDVGYASFFMYKDAGGKLCCGPIWDFDRSLGVIGNNTGAKPYDALWAKEKNIYFNGLLKHSEFEELVANTLAEYKSRIEERLNESFNYIAEYFNSLNRNFDRWRLIGKNVWPNPSDITYLSYEDQIEYCKTYLENSLFFLTQMAYPAD